MNRGMASITIRCARPSFIFEALETGDLPVQDLRGKINGYPARWDRETALNFQTILRERGLYRGALLMPSSAPAHWARHVS